jgi:hypothetical protein
VHAAVTARPRSAPIRQDCADTTWFRRCSSARRI